MVVRTESIPVTDTQQRILDAACSMVVREGYANLTLDAVAREAGVSKGGLLYHFPSKRDLLRGMVEQRCKQFDEQVNAQVARQHGPGRWLRALIAASCAPREIPLQEGAAIFAVLANDPELLKTVQKRREDFRQRIEADEIDPVQATLVMLAVDGLCFSQILGVGVPEPSIREKLIERLLALAGGK